MLDCGGKVWRRRWEEVYKFEVEAFATSRGLRVNLDMLISAVYPALANDGKARAFFAMDFLFKLREERRRITEERRITKREKSLGLAKGNNGGGTK